MGILIFTLAFLAIFIGSANADNHITKTEAIKILSKAEVVMDSGIFYGRKCIGEIRNSKMGGEGCMTYDKILKKLTNMKTELIDAADYLEQDDSPGNEIRMLLFTGVMEDYSKILERIKFERSLK